MFVFIYQTQVQVIQNQKNKDISYAVIIWRLNEKIGIVYIILQKTKNEQSLLLFEKAKNDYSIKGLQMISHFSPKLVNRQLENDQSLLVDKT